MTTIHTMSKTFDEQITKLTKNIARLKNVLKTYDRNLNEACRRAIESEYISWSMNEPCYACCHNYIHHEEPTGNGIRNEYNKLKREKERIDLPLAENNLSNTKKNSNKLIQNERICVGLLDED